MWTQSGHVIYLWTCLILDAIHSNPLFANKDFLTPLLPSPTAMPPAATFATEKDITDAVKQWETCLSRILEANDEDAYEEEEEALYVHMVSLLVFFF